MPILRMVAIAGSVLGLLGSPTLASAISTGAIIRIQSVPFAAPCLPGVCLDEVVTVGDGIESSGFGAITSIAGGPLFLYLLRRHHVRSFSS